MSDLPFLCPICGRQSWHRLDAEHGWCDACQGVTTEPAPEGWRWVIFRGGQLDHCGRLIHGDPADSYHRLGETYLWDSAVETYRLSE